MNPRTCHSKIWKTNQWAEVEPGWGVPAYTHPVKDRVSHSNSEECTAARRAVTELDNEDAEVELSGKAGGSYDVSEDLSVYGEVSFITGDDNGYGTKVGAKYKF